MVWYREKIRILAEGEKDCADTMANLSFYSSEWIQYRTACLVKASCMITLITSFVKNNRKNYWIGAAPSFATSWLALAKWSISKRLSFSIVSAHFAGVQMRNSRLPSEEASKMSKIMELFAEKEKDILSNVIIKMYHDDPRTRPTISKYLYAENLFDDSTTDQPKVRWRCRYFSGNNAIFEDPYLYIRDNLGIEDDESNEAKKISRITDLEEITDPFELVFGIPGWETLRSSDNTRYF